MSEETEATPSPPTPPSADELLASYDFALPEAQIAQHPAPRRDASRLLCLDRHSGATRQARFAQLPDLLEELAPGALLVANNTRVLPARVFGHKPSGGRVELLLLTPLPLLLKQACPAGPDGSHDTQTWAEAEVLLRAAKGPKPGQHIAFPDGLTAEVLARGEFGRSRVRLTWPGKPADLAPLLSRIGTLPLPPYIRRDAESPDATTRAEDAERYQTTYADPARVGSVAAPTAGLHFTPELRAELARRGFGWAELALYVGYGTFSPVRAQDIRNHRMHPELIDVPRETADAVNQAKAQGRPVLAVGTTSVRALEGTYRALGRLDAYTGETDIFIRPGSTFHVVDAMITNFHLPLSSLVIMVSAFAGRKRVLAAYQEAVAAGFRFFSYGDAMLIT